MKETGWEHICFSDVRDLHWKYEAAKAAKVQSSWSLRRSWRTLLDFFIFILSSFTCIDTRNNKGNCLSILSYFYLSDINLSELGPGIHYLVVDCYIVLGFHPGQILIYPTSVLVNRSLCECQLAIFVSARWVWVTQSIVLIFISKQSQLTKKSLDWWEMS